MLGGAGLNNFFSLKLLGGAGMKAPPIQNVYRGWGKKLFLPKMLDGAGKVSPLTQYVRRGWDEKALFAENFRQCWY